MKGSKWPLIEMQYPLEILIYQRYETITMNNKRYFHSASTNFYSLYYIYSFVHISTLRESQHGPTTSKNLRLFSLFSSPNNVACNPFEYFCFFLPQLFSCSHAPMDIFSKLRRAINNAQPFNMCSFFLVLNAQCNTNFFWNARINAWGMLIVIKFCEHKWHMLILFMHLTLYINWQHTIDVTRFIIENTFYNPFILNYYNKYCKKNWTIVDLGPVWFAGLNFSPHHIECLDICMEY
jgi:hypothetical protein